jgi:hypothetical protein
MAPEPRRSPRWLPVVGQAVVLGLTLFGLYQALQFVSTPWKNDAWGFWTMWRGGLYDIPWLEHGAFVYSPAVAQMLTPLTKLSWQVFHDVWNVLQLTALIVMVGPIWAAGLLWLVLWPSLPDKGNFVLATIWNGNPMLLIALSVVAGYRWPGAWALAILLKVTPGIGLLWFAVRREWRNLGIAAGVTLAIVAVSAIAAPGLWFEWFGLLRDSAGANMVDREPFLPVPLIIRVPIAAALIVWGARTDRYWTVPLGVMLSLPGIALSGFAVGVGALAFTRLPGIPRWWWPGSAGADEPAAKRAEPQLTRMEAG